MSSYFYIKMSDVNPDAITGAIMNLPQPPPRGASKFLTAYKDLIYACITRISNEISSNSPKLYKRIELRKNIKTEQVVDHPSLSLLYFVNEFSTITQLLYSTVMYLKLAGEAYWALLRETENGEPMQIWPLRPDWVTIKPSETDFIDYYLYRPRGWAEPIRFEKNEIVPFKDLNPTNPYRGFGAVQASALSIDILDFLQNWNRNFFFNAAIPSLLFTTDKKLKKQEIKRFLAQWKNEFTGVQNASKIGFLGGGFNVETVSTSMRDMDFKNLKESVRDDILAAFGVPKTMLGLTEDVNRASAFTAKQVFAESTIKPILISLASYLNEFYLPLYKNTSSMFYQFDNPAPEDVELNLSVYENALKNGWMTINEVREKESLPPVEGGDSIYLPFSLTPIGSVGKKIKGLFGKKQDKQDGIIKLDVKSEEKKVVDVSIPPRRLRDLRREMIKRNLKPDFVKLVGELMKYKNVHPKSTIKQFDKEEHKENFWKAMIVRADVWEEVFRKKIKSLFKQQQEEILEILNKYKSHTFMVRKQKMDEIIPSEKDVENWNKAWIASLTPFTVNIIQDRGTTVLDTLGLSVGFNMGTANIQKYLKTSAVKFIGETNIVTREKLVRTLTEGIRQEESISDLRERVGEVFVEMDTTRTERITRSEVFRAINQATNEAYKQSGVVTAKEWLTALDERTCQWCEPLNGKVVDIDDMYFKEGDTFVGSDGGEIKLDYLDIPAAPLHPNCRCTIVPVVLEKRVKPRKKIDVVKRLKDTLVEMSDEIAKLKEEKNKAIKEAIDNREKAVGIKNKAIKEAKDEKNKILEIARVEAEEKKKSIIEEVKSLRNKLKEVINGTRKIKRTEEKS